MTEIGETVNQIMKKSFPVIVDLTFTANLESLLDKIEEGVIPWKTVVRNFYPDLEEAVKNAEKELSKYTIEDEVTEVVCDNCGKNMVVKYGPLENFLPAQVFRSAETRNLILKRRVFPVLNVIVKL